MSEAVSHLSSALLRVCSFYLFLPLTLPCFNVYTESPLVTALHPQWSRLTLPVISFLLKLAVPYGKPRGAMETGQDCKRKTHLFPDCGVESSRWVLFLNLILLTNQGEMIIPPYFLHRLGRWNRMTLEESFAKYTVMCICFCSCKLTYLSAFQGPGHPRLEQVDRWSWFPYLLFHPLQVLWSGWYYPILIMKIGLSEMSKFTPNYSSKGKGKARPRSSDDKPSVLFTIYHL